MKRAIGKRRGKQKRKEVNRHQERKKKADFPSDVLRPDDNVTAATCVIMPRTTHCPAAPTLH